MKEFRFNSAAQLGDYLPSFTQLEVKNEPMFWQCDRKFAYENGGPITRAFIDAIKKTHDADDLIIDTRTHMLMPGWWPAIPGYHHDDVPRTRSDFQPNYENPEYKSKHVMALINGDICPTRFALGEITMPDVPLNETIYKTWHPLVEQAVNAGTLEAYDAPSNRLIWFDWETFHQAQVANANGWRWFGRASFDTTNKAKNEIRRQVQVYLEHPMEGW